MPPMLQQECIPSRRQNSLTEFTMQSRLMTEEEKKHGKRSEWFRVNLTGPVKNFPSTLCSLTYITTLVIKNNHLERLPPELGNLINLVNMDASHNKLRVLPPTLGDLTDLRALILNDNKISELPIEIGRLLNLRHFNLHDNPLNADTLSIYGDGSEPAIRRMIRHFMDCFYRYNFTSTPSQRQWRIVDNASADGYPFTLMCYNVLSSNYATVAQYPYCPTWAIDWEYRRRGILEELQLYSPHIICLQEVDTDQFEEVFKPELAKLNYDAVFIPKSRSRTMDPSVGRKVDGCAIFWQCEKFQKIIEFHHEFMLSCSSVSDRPSALLLNRVMTRDNVALGVIFETKGPIGGGRKFCVSTGHIHWDPEHSDVKLIQTIMWTAELWAHLEQFVTKSSHLPSSLSSASSSLSIDTDAPDTLPKTGNCEPKSASQMPVIFCGDFNSLPSSGVVEFLSKGCVPKSHVEFLNNGFNYQFEDWKMLEKWAVDGDILRHRFNFNRAYNEGNGMRITNFTYDFKGMIDYIFFTRQHFRILGSLDQVPDNWLAEERILGCPHIYIPSDHFSLLVELDLLANSEQTVKFPEPNSTVLSQHGVDKKSSRLQASNRNSSSDSNMKTNSPSHQGDQSKINHSKAPATNGNFKNKKR